MLKKNLTRETLTEKINKDIGFSKNISKSLIDDIFHEIISALINTNEVKISSFGTFKTINKKERIGRNPKTKEEAKISARKVVVFRPSKQLKEKINNER
tara:strand:- start:135 stop:431 length:297 start_codon:yes stop_codon:yes gene_type:complete